MVRRKQRSSASWRPFVARLKGEATGEITLPGFLLEFLLGCLLFTVISPALSTVAYDERQGLDQTLPWDQ